MSTNSSLTLDADSLANLLASVSDFDQVDIADGEVIATDSKANIVVRLSGLKGNIGLTLGGITFDIPEITITKTEMKAAFTIAKPA